MTNAPVIRIRARVPQWSFPERLRKVRREMDLDQSDMAAQLGVKESTYSAWETGRNKPDVLTLSETLEQITGVSKFWFRGDLDGNGPVGPEGLEPPTSTVKTRSFGVIPGPWVNAA
jgi:transcriptional regulator with XRE-family HTH domain